MLKVISIVEDIIVLLGGLNCTVTKKIQHDDSGREH